MRSVVETSSGVLTRGEIESWHHWVQDRTEPEREVYRAFLPRILQAIIDARAERTRRTREEPEPAAIAARSWDGGFEVKQEPIAHDGSR